MRWVGSMSGDQVGRSRRHLAGATVVAGQIGCWAGLAGNGVVGDPASVNDYSEAIGVVKEAITYSTTQGGGGQVVEVTVDPNQIIRGKVSGGTAADTAWVDGTDGNLLTNTSASAGGTVITDGDVATSEYIGGYVIGLTGNNKGHVRVIDAHTDSTSTTVDDPFDNAIAVGDTFLRTFGPFLQGIELTTNFVQFNGRTGSGVDLPDTGHGAIYDVWCDRQRIIIDTGAASLRNPSVDIRNTTNPLIEIDIILIDHVFKSLA